MSVVRRFESDVIHIANIGRLEKFLLQRPTVMTENHSAGLLQFLSPGTHAARDSAVPTANLSVEGSSIKLDDLGPMVVNSDGVSVKADEMHCRHPYFALDS